MQEYLDKPFLVDGFKCDMRIYVLVASCDPLRVFLYHDGLLRLATERYVHPNEANSVGVLPFLFGKGDFTVATRSYIHSDRKKRKGKKAKTNKKRF